VAKMADSPIKKAEREKSLCSYCKAPLRGGHPQYLSNYWGGTTKQKDMKEKNQTQTLMSHSARYAKQNTGNLSTDKLTK